MVFKHECHDLISETTRFNGRHELCQTHLSLLPGCICAGYIVLNLWPVAVAESLYLTAEAEVEVVVLVVVLV